MRPGSAPAFTRGRRALGSICAVLALGLPVSTLALALSVEGEAVALGQPDRGTAPAPRYRFRVDQCESRIRSEWHSASGELVAWDEVEFDAMHWRSYRLVRPNLAQDFRQQAASARAGRPAAGDAPFLAGPMLIDFATRELPALRAGRSLEVRYLIAESGQDVRLRLRATQISATGTVVAIDAAQVWLRPLIPRARFEFDGAGRFASMRGQILPQGGSARHPEPIAAAVTVLASRPTSRCNN
jgi:hypothetical protein